MVIEGVYRVFILTIQRWNPVNLFFNLD